jgi:hypothetical protein
MRPIAVLSVVTCINRVFSNKNGYRAYLTDKYVLTKVTCLLLAQIHKIIRRHLLQHTQYTKRTTYIAQCLIDGPENWLFVIMVNTSTTM